MENFEISLWEDFLVTTENDSYYDERKLAILGSDTMTESIRACNPKLVSNINGTNTFTFDMVMYCEDIQLVENGDYYEYLTYNGESLIYGDQPLLVSKKGAAQYIQNGKIKNPWLDKLSNERKIKLKWRDKWYDFLIKSKQTKSDNKMVSITCKDLYQTELGKNGYSLEFDNELMNNSGTMKEMVERVLEGTDWKVSDDSEEILQLTEEALYYDEIEFDDDIGSNFKNCKNPTKTLSAITGKQNCYFFYSQVSKSSTEPIQLQIIFEQNKNYPKDDGKMLITDNSLNYYYDTLCNVNVEDSTATITPVGATLSLAKVKLSNGVSREYRGDRFVRSEQTKVDTRLKKSVTVYTDTNNNVYHGYKETIFTGNVEQLISNSSCFGDLGGWSADGYNLSLTQVPKLKLVYPETSKSILRLESISGYTADKKLHNTGIRDNLSVLPNGISSGNKFYLRYKIRDNENKYITSNVNIIPHLVKKDSNNNSIDLFGKESESESSSINGDWNCFIVTARDTSQTATYSEINNGEWDFYFSFDTSSESLPNPLLIEAIEFFEYLESEYISPEFTPSKRYSEGAIVSVTTSDSATTTTTTTYYRAIRSTQTVETFISSYDPSTPGPTYWAYNYEDNNYSYGTYTTTGTHWPENWYTYPSQLETFWSKIGESCTSPTGSSSTQPEKVQVFPDNVYTTGIPVQRYFFYDRDANRNITNKADMSIQVYESMPSDYTVQYIDPLYGKVRTISQKESNRFNILQSISENFEAYLLFEVEHETNGKVKRKSGQEYSPVRSLTKDLFDLNKGKYWYKNEDNFVQCNDKTIFDYNITYYIELQNRPQKNIKISSKSGQETGLSFKYGLDLKSIQRTDASDNIVTKTIVKPNSNECAKNGFCTIARASENYSKAGYIINFDYYINQGLLDYEDVYKDVYQGTDSLYEKLAIKNTEYDNAYEIYASQKKEYDNVISQYEVQVARKSAAESEKNEIFNQIVSYYTANGHLGSYTPEKFKETIQALVAENGPRANDDKLKGYSAAYSEALEQMKNAEEQIAAIEVGKEPLEALISEKEKEVNALAAEIEEIENNFYKKYSRFIQEGTWSQDSYVDDNLYYLDALNVSYKGSRPTVSYTINAVALAGVEGFEKRQFNLGDICFIQDPDYFGFKDEEGLDPYKEKVIITEITFNLMDPSKDSFKIQNYKTQFEDLFQKITSSVQSLSYAKGDYDKASKSFTQDGYLQNEVLQDSIDNDGVVISGGKKTNIIIDPDGGGITIKDTNNPQKQLKITSDGLIGTTSGGDAWSRIITSKGVSSNTISSGQLNVDELNIISNENSNFKWDANGINAYGVTKGSNDIVITDTSNFVRFDRYGLYGMQNVTGDSTTYTPPSNSYESACKDIRDRGSFGLIWDGFFLNNSYLESTEVTKGYTFRIDNTDDLTVTRDSMTWYDLGYLDYTTWSNKYTTHSGKVFPLYYDIVTTSKEAQYEGFPEIVKLYANTTDDSNRWTSYANNLSKPLYRIDTTTVSAEDTPEPQDYYYNINSQDVSKALTLVDSEEVLADYNTLDDSKNLPSWEEYANRVYLYRYWDDDGTEVVKARFPAYTLQPEDSNRKVRNLFDENDKQKFCSWGDGRGGALPPNYKLNDEDIGKTYYLYNTFETQTRYEDMVQTGSSAERQYVFYKEGEYLGDNLYDIYASVTVTTENIGKTLNETSETKERAIYLINQPSLRKTFYYEKDSTETPTSETTLTRYFRDKINPIASTTQSTFPKYKRGRYCTLTTQSFASTSSIFSPNSSIYFKYVDTTINTTTLSTGPSTYIRGAKYQGWADDLPFVKLGRLADIQTTTGSTRMNFGLEISKGVGREEQKDFEQYLAFKVSKEGMYLNINLIEEDGRTSQVKMDTSLDLKSPKEDGIISINPSFDPGFIQLGSIRKGELVTTYLSPTHINTPKVMTDLLSATQVKINDFLSLGGDNNGFVSLVGDVSYGHSRRCVYGGYYDLGKLIYVDCAYTVAISQSDIKTGYKRFLSTKLPAPAFGWAALSGVYCSLDASGDDGRTPLDVGIGVRGGTPILWFQPDDKGDSLKFYWNESGVTIYINGLYTKAT